LVIPSIGQHPASSKAGEERDIQPGTKSRDGFKRFIHARGDYQDTYALRYHPGAKRHLKREASRARRKMDKVVVLDLAA